jgi:hypothetical protein
MKKLWTGSLVGAMMLCVTGVSQATIYNPITDFSITNGNPNGVWTYGWMPSDLSTFYTDTITQGLQGVNWDCWWGQNQQTHVCLNNLTFTSYGVQPGQISLHPGAAYQAAVLRFTAPTAGLYDIGGQFFAGDNGTMLVGVRQEANFLWNGVNAGIFSMDDKTFSAGDSIDFLVYGGYGAGNTPLSLTISSAPFPARNQVPEPASVLLISAGLAYLVSVRRKQKFYRSHAPAWERNF